MNRVTIVSPKIYLKEVIDSLYSMGVLHIKDYIPRGNFSIGKPMDDAEKISELILDLQSIKTHISLPEGAEELGMKAIESLLKNTKARITALNSEIMAINERRKALEKEKEELEFLSNAGIESLDALGGYENFELAFGYAANPASIKKQDVEVFFSKKIGRVCPVAVLFRKGKKPKLPLEEIKLTLEGKGNVTEKLEEAGKELEELERKKAEIGKRLEEIAAESGKKLNYAESLLFERIKKSEAPLKFASTEYAFLVNGWVPAKNSKKLVERLSATSKNIFAKIEEVGDEEAPTKLDNPRAVRPFEFFLNLYSLPKYDEIEPSFLIFLSFPLFFGFMLGDIGYGLIVLLLSIFLRTKNKALFDIMIAASLVTIFFGFVFGEAFGSEHILGIELHPYFHRIEGINELIIASAIIGLVHINMGLIMGFVNELHRHGFAKAFMGKISWMGIQIAGILFLLDIIGVVSADPAVPAAIFVISLLGIIKSEGMLGIIELPSIISNILSYFRLAAIGLASASLAVVINNLAGPAFQQGGFMTIVGVFVLLTGHAINLALGVIGPFLQSMRLHYVELLPKFYKGSGKPYEPFGK